MKSSATLNRQNSSSEGPFTATKLWNQIIYDFSRGIKLKRHRKSLRIYSDTFVATKAVDWLHCYLVNHKPCHNKPVSRQQAIQLLDKFLRYDIIEKAIHKSSDTIMFKDNKDLYRLKKENIPFPHLSSNGQEYEEEVTSPSSLKTGANSTLRLNDTIDSIATSYVNSSSSSILHPTISEASVAWKEIVLHQLKNVQPLYASFINTRDINETNIYKNATRVSKNGVVSVDDKSKDVPHWVMSAMRCLANWPNENTGSLPRYNGFERDVFNLIREYFVNLECPLIPHYFYPLLISMVEEADQQYIQRIRSKYFGNNSELDQQSEANGIYRTNSTTLSVASRHSDPYYYHHNHRKECKKKKEQVFETIFHADNSVSRILSHDQLASFFANFNSSDGSLDDRPLSPDDHHPKSPYCGISDVKKLQHIATLPRLIKKQRLEDKINRANSFKSLSKRPLGIANVGFILQSPSEEGEYMMDKSVSSSFVVRNGNSIYSSQSLYSTLFCSKDSVKYSKSIELLSLVVLMIPPENRRHLHLLLRLLTRISRNKDLKIFSNSFASIEYYLIETFTRCIIYSGYEKTYNEVAAQYLVSLMVKHTGEIFAAPNFLKNNACQTVEENT